MPSYDYRAPNAEKSKQGMLTEIHYPTGGKSTFEYQSHDYEKMVNRLYDNTFKPKLYDTEIRKSAGGVRISKIHDYDAEGAYTTREFIYESRYGLSSGTLLQMPRYSIFYLIQSGFDKLGHDDYTWSWVSMINSNLRILTTAEDYHIGYSQVIEKLNDGSEIHYKFSDYEYIPDRFPYKYPNPRPGAIVRPGPPQEPLVDGDDVVNNIMNNSISYHSQRGKLIEKSIHNPTKDTLYREQYVYDRNKSLAGLPFYRQPLVIIYRHQVLIDDYPLEKVIKTDFRNGERIVDQIAYAYNNFGQTVTEQTTDSQGRILRVKTQYPYDLNPQGGIEKRMLDANVVNSPLRTLSSLQETPAGAELLTGGAKYTYQAIPGTAGNEFFRLSEMQPVGLTTPLSLTGFNIDSHLNAAEVTYDKYDSYGRLLQTTGRDGIPTTYIWGYGGLYPVAKIVNTSLDAVKRLSGFENIDQTPLANALEDRVALEALPNVLITSYTYKPFVGIASVMDPSGRVTSYDYDDHGRLKEIKDQDGNLIEGYRYNYAQ